MSDDLVKRLRGYATPDDVADELMEDAADRIEKLETNFQLQLEWYLSNKRVLDDRIKKLEAALSLSQDWIKNRASHAGDFCTSNQCVCGKALVLFNARKALEGEDD